MKNKIAEFIEIKLIAIVISLISIFASLIRFNLKWFSNYEQLLTNTITLSSIFIGVIMSMLGFLLTISGRKIIIQLVNMQFHKMILKYFISPITVGILLVVISLTGSVILSIDYKNEFVYPIISILWLVLAVYFLLSFIRITLLVYKILELAFNEISEVQDVESQKETINKILIDNELSETEEDFY